MNVCDVFCKLNFFKVKKEEDKNTHCETSGTVRKEEKKALCVCVSGVYTGSVYSRRGDPELWRQGYLGEGVHNRE